jgi:23S rRNA (cytosine1962-C5)-methyltransferase
MDLLEDHWLPALKATDPLVQAWIIRKDSGSRQLEKIENEEPRVIGTLIDHQIIGQEGSIHFIADVLEGQKTGWFYDQRENRALIAKWIKPGDTVLDLFTHTGSFALYAAQKGAIVDAVDRSALALTLAAKAALLNQLPSPIQWHQAQVFTFLEQEQRFFDLVIVDPPAFVKSKATLNQGIQGYIKLLSQALKIVKPNGLLCFTSCSHLITPTDINEIMSKASLKTQRHLTILAHLSAGFDHPVRLALPELSYLKGVFVRVD